MSWVFLLPAEARAGLHRPTTLIGAAWFLLSGLVFALMMDDGAGYVTARPLVGTTMQTFIMGVHLGIIPAILLGAAVGGEDDDLGTKQDLWLSNVPAAGFFICKLVIAVDLVVALSFLTLIGGGFVGLYDLLFRGGVLFGEAFDGQVGFLWKALGEVVLVLPFTVVASACTAAILRSRFWAVAVWLGFVTTYILGVLLAQLSPLFVYLTRLVPFGSAIALATGEAWPGFSSTSMEPASALALSLAWLTILAVCAARRVHGWGSAA